MKEQIQSPIVKIIILIVILAAFGAIIFAISFAFATKCPTGQTWDKDQQKCIKTCVEDEEVYDTDINDCRPICTGNSVWSRSLNTCKECPVGSTWNETSQECLLYCSDTTECTTDQSCVEGKCCNYKPCKTIAGDKCCQTCTPDTQNAGYSICCAPEKTCVINGQTTCCPGGQICNNGTECVNPCGPAGSNKICGSNTECVTIKNVDPIKNPNIFNQLNSNKENLWEQNSDKTYNFYTCLSNKNLCNSSNSFAGPAETANFYPCFDMGNMDKNKILAYTKDNINQFNSNLGQGQGYYCNDGSGKNLSRLYGVELDTNKCNYTNCIAMLANPSVTDVYYDEKTGNCTSIQSCTDNISNLQTSIDNKNLGFLQSCKDSNIDVCKNLGDKGEFCESSSGLIQTLGYNCDPNNSSGYKNGCICKPDTSGVSCQYSRTKTCNGHGSPNNDGTCKCDPFYQNVPAPIGCTLIITKDYFEKNSGWKSGPIYNWLSQYADTNKTGELKYTNSNGEIITANDVSWTTIGWEYLYVMVLGNNNQYICNNWSATDYGNRIFQINNALGVQVSALDGTPPIVPNSNLRIFQSYKNTDENYFVNFILVKVSDGHKYGFSITNIKDSNTLSGPSDSDIPHKFYAAGAFYPASPAILLIYASKYLNGTN